MSEERAVKRAVAQNDETGRPHLPNHLIDRLARRRIAAKKGLLCKKRIGRMVVDIQLHRGARFLRISEHRRSGHVDRHKMLCFEPGHFAVQIGEICGKEIGAADIDPLSHRGKGVEQGACAAVGVPVGVPVAEQGDVIHLQQPRGRRFAVNLMTSLLLEAVEYF